MIWQGHRDGTRLVSFLGTSISQCDAEDPVRTSGYPFAWNAKGVVKKVTCWRGE